LIRIEFTESKKGGGKSGKGGKKQHPAAEKEGVEKRSPKTTISFHSLVLRTELEKKRNDEKRHVWKRGGQGKKGETQKTRRVAKNSFTRQLAGGSLENP